MGRSHSSTGQLRDRSPIRPKKRPPKEYVKPDWAKKGDDDGDAALSKKANSILNKLTLEKFDRLSTEFCALEFSTLERVAGAVDLIVTKAQTESHFVSVYASLCVKLANTPNEALGEDEGSTKKFRRCELGVPSCGGAFTPSTRLASPGMMDVGGLFVEFEAVRTALTEMLRAGYS